MNSSCATADLTGYKGRIGIYELLYLDDSIRSAIRDGGRSDTVRALARANGMRLMHEYALEHVLHGLTTLEEVQRVVPLEQVANVSCASCLRELSPTFVFCPYCGEKRTVQEAPLPPQTAVELGSANEIQQSSAEVGQSETQPAHSHREGNFRAL